jgi:hypothetical protein
MDSPAGTAILCEFAILPASDFEPLSVVAITSLLHQTKKNPGSLDPGMNFDYGAN